MFIHSFIHSHIMSQLWVKSTFLIAFLRAHDIIDKTFHTNERSNTTNNKRHSQCVNKAVFSLMWCSSDMSHLEACYWLTDWSREGIVSRHHCRPHFTTVRSHCSCDLRITLNKYPTDLAVPSYNIDSHMETYGQFKRF